MSVKKVSWEGRCVHYAQVQMRIDDQTAVGRLLDIVTEKLVGDDVSAFNQLVYSLVRTDQQQCARMLDNDLTEKYLQDMAENDSKHG